MTVIQDQRNISIRTSSGYAVNGYIMAQLPAGAIIRVIDDFILDGFSFYPQKSINSIDTSSSPTSDFFERVFREEWLFDAIDFSETFDVSTITEFFSKHLIQKDAYIEYHDWKFFFGRILAVEGSEALMQTFDSDGTWWTKQGIDLSSIFVVQWDTCYLAQFTKRLPLLSEYKNDL